MCAPSPGSFPESVGHTVGLVSLTSCSSGAECKHSCFCFRQTEARCVCCHTGTIADIFTADGPRNGKMWPITLMIPCGPFPSGVASANCLSPFNLHPPASIHLRSHQLITLHPRPLHPFKKKCFLSSKLCHNACKQCNTGKLRGIFKCRASQCVAVAN